MLNKELAQLDEAIAPLEGLIYSMIFEKGTETARLRIRIEAQNRRLRTLIDLLKVYEKNGSSED